VTDVLANLHKYDKENTAVTGFAKLRTVTKGNCKFISIFPKAPSPRNVIIFAWHLIVTASDLRKAFKSRQTFWNTWEGNENSQLGWILVS